MAFIYSKNVIWEIQWKTKRYIEERKNNYHIKSHFWLYDKELQLTVREYISFFEDKLLAQKLTKALGEH